MTYALTPTFHYNTITESNVWFLYFLLDGTFPLNWFSLLWRHFKVLANVRNFYSPPPLLVSLLDIVSISLLPIILFPEVPLGRSLSLGVSHSSLLELSAKGLIWLQLSKKRLPFVPLWMLPIHLTPHLHLLHFYSTCSFLSISLTCVEYLLEQFFLWLVLFYTWCLDVSCLVHFN